MNLYKNKILFLGVVFFLFLSITDVNARDRIKIVGSSTAYPFVTIVSEEFSMNYDTYTPIVESTGSGTGFKLFCSGIGFDYPDFVNSSRPMKESEKKYCYGNGVRNIFSIPIGYDGIVIINKKDEYNYNFTIRELFLALVKTIPQNGKLIQNNFKYWSDINPNLPKKEIAFYGPPTTSGTRDAFVEIIMEKGCALFPEYNSFYGDSKSLKEACHSIRNDGTYMDSGENDNLLVLKILSNPDSLGIIGYNFYIENTDKLQAAAINTYKPTYSNIQQKLYPMSRMLYVYGKAEHLTLMPNMTRFVNELISDNASSEEGYLVDSGLIPMSKNELSKSRTNIFQFITQYESGKN